MRGTLASDHTPVVSTIPGETMTQGVGPDEEPLEETTEPEEQEEKRTRSSAAPWIALAILLLIIIWLIWQYLGGVGTVPDTRSVTTSSEITVTAEGPGTIEPETTEGEVATETAEAGPVVPDVIGMSRSAAVAAVEAAGYKASVTVVYGTSQPAGTVFRQNPSGGSALEPGGSVGMLVQLRPSQKPTVTVPDLVGRTEKSAKAALADLGLRPVLSYAPAFGNPGIVHSQWPLGGDDVVEGGDVQIQITVDR
ncbi:MAG: PASTA domain-containing protein [Coriobacteriia bacterium]|nr:PASTA domain-containing protein [Coriobacteriia bacterium]